MELSLGGRKAVRLHGCYDNAVVVSERPLADGEVFEITLDKAGSSFGTLEAGECPVVTDVSKNIGVYIYLLFTGIYIYSAFSVVQCSNEPYKITTTLLRGLQILALVMYITVLTHD